jgi:hypothetical protein
VAIDPATVISTISAAINFARELNSINKTVDEATWRLKVAELTGALADAKLGATELKDLIDERDKEIARLTKAFAFRGETIEKHNMVYEKRGDRAVGMPFCPRCMEVDGRFIKLTNLMKPGRPTQCPQCKSDFDHQTEYLPPDE